MAIIADRPMNGFERLIVGWVIGSLAWSLGIALLGLEEIEQLVGALSYVGVVIPAVSRWAAVSANPAHTIIFFSSLWSVAPLFMVAALSNMESYFPQSKHVAAVRLFFGFFVLATVSLAITVLGLGSLRTLAADYDGLPSLASRMLSSRISTGLIGGLLVFVSWYSIAGTIGLAAKVIRGAGK